MERFSASDLKITAMATMVIDHAAVVLLSGQLPAEPSFAAELNLAMRSIGRVAFPLFVFLLVEGFLHTHDWKKYALRLLGTALLSEIPYNLLAGGTLLDSGEQNVMFTLLIALLVLAAIAAAQKRWEKGNGLRYTAVIAAVLLGGFLALILRTDYDLWGVLLAAIFYLFRYRPSLRMFFAGAVFLLLYGPWLMLFAMIAFFFINGYNGQKGRSMGAFPYLFYPAHILLLLGIGVFVHGIYH